MSKAPVRYMLGVGRRKESVARVKLVPGTGKISINKREVDDYLTIGTQKMLAFGVDANAFMKYNPAYGLYLSVAISGSILLYFSLQLIFRNKRVVMPSAWLEPKGAGRFYIPAHHNTSL